MGGLCCSKDVAQLAILGHPVIVVGMDRSGTSSITQALVRLGLYIGEPGDLLPADGFNSDGYWEHQRLMDVNQSLLKHLGMFQGLAEPFPADWQNYDRIDADLQKIQAVLERTFQDRPLWGWKDPRTTRLLPLWRKVLENNGLAPQVVICVRNPLNVAASMHRRDGFNESTVVGMWLSQTLSALSDSRGLRRNIVLYEDFLEDPEKAIRPIADSPLWSRDETVWASLRDIPKPTLNHGRKDLEELAQMKPDLVARTFQVCERAAAQPQALQFGAFDEEVERLREEFIAWQLLIPGPIRFATIAFLQWNDKVSQGSSATYYPMPRRQVVSIELPSLPKGSVLGSIAHLPGDYYIRRVRIVDKKGQEELIKLVPLEGVETRREGAATCWVLRTPSAQFRFSTNGFRGPCTFEFEVSSDMAPLEMARVNNELTQRVHLQQARIAELEEMMKKMAKSQLASPIGSSFKGR